MSDTDLQLLSRYTRHQAEDAFAELVRRHVDLVHSAALRQVRSPQLAEEVAQSVFIDLARQARRLAPKTILTAWLYEVTRRTAIDVVRREARRQLREQIATEMNVMNATAADWTHIEPLLDEAMHALDETDRAAVLLRYFENKSLREVGAALGTSDDAAQKRVSRAVERLREFFGKRGVGVGASGLAVVLSANAVQAAPIGLVLTISTAAALTGTAIVTTATKAIAMTTMQKTLIATSLAAAVGVGFYEARQASVARAEVLVLRQQGMLLAEQIEQSARERDATARELAALHQDRELLDRATSELLKLRGEVTRLKLDAQAQMQGSITNDQTLSEAVVWKGRVDQLKQYLERSPGSIIPELQFATEQDWLDAAKRNLATDADYRSALSALRTASEQKVASMFMKAVKAYKKASNENFPNDWDQLMPYFESPLDRAILERWQIVPGKTVQSIGVGDVIITQKAPVDDVFDRRIVVGSDGGTGATDFMDPESWKAMAPVFEAYQIAHGGQSQDALSQLHPYARTPAQQAALQKLLLRESVGK